MNRMLLFLTLSWNQHIIQIVSKANKMLGLLRRTCPLLTDRVARRTLYLSLVKSQLGYATEVWTPSQSTNKTEDSKACHTVDPSSKDRRDLIYKDRLLALSLLPLSYDRETKDLTFFFKAMYNGYYDLNISDYVSFVSHSRTRNCVNPSLMLKVPLCKTSTFQSSYFNRIVPLWNRMCRTAKHSDS